MSSPRTNFVTAAELNALRAGRDPVRVIDVRWSLERPDGLADYRAGHVPGAVYVSLPKELAAPGRPSEGRHPSPSTAALQAAARRWGVRAGDSVIAYDDVNGAAAARAWWLLRQGGVPVRVLAGGLRAWRSRGFDVATGDVTPEPGDVVLDALGADAVSIDEAAAFPTVGVLVDVRDPGRYRGDDEPIDPSGGHIPGARNMPTTRHMDDDDGIRDPDAIRADFASIGVAPGMPVAVYCGSGVAASHSALVLDEIGIAAKVYVGSWSQWSNIPGRQIASGAEPG